MIEKIFIIILSVESIVLHEMAHGYVALLFGDRTAKDRGRLTLNPIPHIDPVWTIIIPIIAYILSKGTFIIGPGRYLRFGCRCCSKPTDSRSDDSVTIYY